MMRVEHSPDAAIRAGPVGCRCRPERRRQGHLLRFARNHLGGDPNIVFPHRVVPGSRRLRKDHEALPKRTLLPQLRPAFFAFWWYAHGLNYAVGRAVDDDIRAGKNGGLQRLACRDRGTSLPLRPTFASFS